MPFLVREIRISPGSGRRYEDQDWWGALVLVQVGSVELETMSGARASFSAGSILFLAGLRLRLLRNPGSVTTVLRTIIRKYRPDETSPSLNRRRPRARLLQLARLRGGK